MDTIGALRQRCSVIALLLNNGSNRRGRAAGNVSFFTAASLARRERSRRACEGPPPRDAVVAAHARRWHGILSFE
ncbi:hypothetical protein [Rhizobacter sp. Root1221]|uniref:hypothetical protein n=1 Tax=Rhizobacter sp. Root1221 TaxID=1736433 RepID=UPI0006FFAE49|nr:hypothetical protein [Rhizobacter sp. Root1221]KQV97587.1 hypothetical protein ASC87_23290 [Rhizobacter sp. Root1221]